MRVGLGRCGVAAWVERHIGLGVGDGHSLAAVRNLVAAAGRVPGMGRRTHVAEADSQGLVDRMRFAEGTLEAGVGCIRAGGADILVVDVVVVDEKEEVRNLAVEDMEESCGSLDKAPARVDCILVEVHL